MNTSLEHKHIGARTRQGSASEDASRVLECMFSVQPQPAAPMGPQHEVINLMSTFQILSHPLLMLRLPEWLPGDLRHSEQLVSWRASCLFVLRCQTRPTMLSTQRRLPTAPRESAKTHPRAQLHRSDAIWDPMPMLRPHTHRPHPRLWKVVDLNSQANPSLCPAFTHTNRFLVSYLLYFAVYCLVVLTDDE